MRHGGALDAATYERKTQVLQLADNTMYSLQKNIREFDREDRRDAANYQYLKNHIAEVLKFLDDMDRY